MNEKSVLPDRITAGWVAWLANGTLVEVEAALHTSFIAVLASRRPRA